MAILLSVTAGFVVGATVSGLLAALWTRRHVCPDREAHRLSHADREDISAEFAAHATSVRRELSRYADALSEGDCLLREQLRRVEAGMRS
jgi:hypothetical protein